MGSKGLERIPVLPHKEEGERASLDIDLGPVLEALAALARVAAERRLREEEVTEALGRRLEVSQEGSLILVKPTPGATVTMSIDPEGGYSVVLEAGGPGSPESLVVTGEYSVGDLLYMLGCSFCNARSLLEIVSDSRLRVGASSPPVVGYYFAHIYQEEDALLRLVELALDAARAVLRSLWVEPPRLGDLVYARAVVDAEETPLSNVEGILGGGGELLEDLYLGRLYAQRGSVIISGEPVRRGFVAPSLVSPGRVEPREGYVLDIPSVLSRAEELVEAARALGLEAYESSAGGLVVRGELVESLVESSSPFTGTPYAELRLDVDVSPFTGPLGVARGSLEIRLVEAASLPSIRSQSLLERLRGEVEDIAAVYATLLHELL